MKGLGNIAIVGSVIPSDPEITIDRAPNGTPIRYCIDAQTENKLQRQRLVTGLVGGPLVIWAGWRCKSNIFMRGLIMGSGALAMITSFSAYYAVAKAENR